jgi:hypothetical protein
VVAGQSINQAAPDLTLTLANGMSLGQQMKWGDYFDGLNTGAGVSLEFGLNGSAAGYILPGVTAIDFSQHWQRDVINGGGTYVGSGSLSLKLVPTNIIQQTTINGVGALKEPIAYPHFQYIACDVGQPSYTNSALTFSVPSAVSIVSSFVIYSGSSSVSVTFGNGTSYSFPLTRNSSQYAVWYNVAGISVSGRAYVGLAISP